MPAPESRSIRGYENEAVVSSQSVEAEPVRNGEFASQRLNCNTACGAGNPETVAFGEMELPVTHEM